jgi:hypothetical protein
MEENGYIAGFILEDRYGMLLFDGRDEGIEGLGEACDPCNEPSDMGFWICLEPST